MRWSDRIKRAEKRGEFNEVDQHLASEYETCAIGERISDLLAAGITPNIAPSFHLGQGRDVDIPHSEDMRAHAIHFHWAILDNRLDDAATRYAAIQAWDGS